MEPPAPAPLDLRFIADALSGAVGQEKATHSVSAAAEELGLAEQDRLTQPEALAILAEVADGDDLLSLSARFARSRLMAKWATQRLNDRARARDDQ